LNYVRDRVTVIESLEVAYATFQCLRYGNSRSQAMLDLLVQTLEAVERTGNVEVEVPTSSLATMDLQPRFTVDALATRHQVADLPTQQQRLLELMRASAVESQKLCSSNPPVAVMRSLGYALHALPALVRSGGYEAKTFRQFGFRVAAYAWSDLSVGMRRILCELADMSIDQAEKLIPQDGFVIKMYGGRSPGVP
jgi:hypothetical protein